MRRSSWVAIGMAAVLGGALAGCSDRPTEMAAVPNGNRIRQGGDTVTPRLVRQLARERGVTAYPRPPHVRPALVRLGRELAFDKILSGNHDVSCMTCHLPRYETGDGRSLSIGSGGVGLGPNRTQPDGVDIPRNAPPLFNLGAMRHLFWDGRVEVDGHGHFTTPAGAQLTKDMTKVLEFGPVSAQPMFPPTSAAEMRGTSGSELSKYTDDDATQIWAALMKRLGKIPKYRRMFEEAYPGKRFDQMNFAYASNAIGGFIVSEMTFRDTPWDRFLAGDDRALSQRQLDGAETFLTLKCSICHNGPNLSDDEFHNVAVAQIGPGKGNGASLRDDFGRMNVTGDPADQYRFRTSPLRNVELTGPYGHDGSTLSLRDFIDHYSNSDEKLMDYNPAQLIPPLRNTVLDNKSQVIAERDTIIVGVVLTPEIEDRLMDYMSALTDPAARNLSRLTPRKVPSGLPIDR
ncbi:MAG TPA: cytochrome c peroxidase [Gemmatimonadaceae bacterium]|nr:cytochrome c peroxidase [Gemmatimonadaceae bacterium]